MPRGLRKDTYDRIADARSRYPLGLGPYLGALACRANISAGQIATVVGAHETTVFRWFFGQGEVQPPWAFKVSRMVALMVWMHDQKLTPLVGSLDERSKLLVQHSRRFEMLARGGANGVQSVKAVA